MPTKIVTETQLLRLLSNTPLQIHVTLVSLSGHVAKNTSPDHMTAFYVDSSEILNRHFDGRIVTGAPVELLSFEKVDYWNRLTTVFEWARTHVYSSLFICWGANAALYYYYGIQKRVLDKKLSGIFELEIRDTSSLLLRGFDDRFLMPQSRYATVLPEDVAATNLTVLADSPEAGAVILAAPEHRQVFVTGHLEYDISTIDLEYRRDLAAGLAIDLPVNYYQDDDPNKPPLVKWRTYAHQFFANWLNHCVYQATPYNLTDIT
jgi:homoserine O-succinyltransferase